MRSFAVTLIVQCGFALISTTGAVKLCALRIERALKSVAPALMDGFGYDDLATEIAGGSEASVAFLRLASGLVIDVEEESRLRQALRAYCERDTLALVEVHRALRARVCPGSGQPERVE